MTRLALAACVLVASAAVTPGVGAEVQANRRPAVRVPSPAIAPVPSHRAEWGALLPPGPGRDYVVGLCGHCHTAGVLVLQHRTTQAWRDHLLGARTAREISAELCFCLGAFLDDEEVDIVSIYLGKVSGKDNPIDQLPLNVNTASEAALRRIPGLTARDVQRLIDLRAKGPVTSKDEVATALGPKTFQRVEDFLDVKDSIFRSEGLIPM